MQGRLKLPIPALLTCLVVLLWALYTQHVWEDYYITYRASKNLALGHGLTFTPGERVHSFTSPLGVLLPAAASLLTGNRSDAVALWIFRCFGAAALAGAIWFLRRACLQSPVGKAAALLATVLVLGDVKIVDNTINGMETPFLLLFLGWTWWALVTAPARRWLHLGLAWGGLMWTRPDAFVYIGALAFGTALFRPADSAWWADRLRLLREYAGAGLVATLLYLPWLLWAGNYYGTPLPHTITAKGLFLPKPSAGVVWDWVTGFPGALLRDHSILAGTFTPPYSHNTGWAPLVGTAAFVLGLAAILLWLVPRLRWEARVASFTAATGQFYLYSCVRFPVPWYLPPVAFFALAALALTWGQLWTGSGATGTPYRKFKLGALAAVAGLWVLGAGLLLLASAYQLRLQQRIVEDGHRRGVGTWLREHAQSPADTVFLEPLGYIGYFSGLKMLDFPGLCSPEVVAARRRASSPSYPFCWSELIMDLHPRWLVLRPYEATAIREREPLVLDRHYELAHRFDVTDKIAAISFLPGRGYLTNDAVFEVYRRRDGWPTDVILSPIGARALLRNQSWTGPAYDSGDNLAAHAPSLVTFAIPLGARRLSGGFGIFEGAYNDNAPGTDGAVFHVRLVEANGDRRTLFERSLNPRATPEDRGLQPLRVEFPPTSDGSIELEVTTGAAGNFEFDWTYWSRLAFETPRQGP